MSIKDLSPDATLSGIVKFLDKLEYQDDNFANRNARLETLNLVWKSTAEHFENLIRAEKIRVAPKLVYKAIQPSVRGNVYSLGNLSIPLLVDLSIYWTFFFINELGGFKDPSMETFLPDLLSGAEQRSEFWFLMNEHLPRLLSHYGPFCGLTIFRSTLGWCQGSWLEKRNIIGYPGAHRYPTYLRHLTGLSENGCVSLFPKEIIDEDENLQHIAVLLPHMVTYVDKVNDLFSFYKEVHDPDDRINAATTYSHAHGVTLQESFEYIVEEAVSCLEQIRTVFTKGRVPAVQKVVESTLQGYVTYHICEDRYRLGELTEKGGDDPNATEFSRYYNMIRKVGWFDPSEWPQPRDV
ncbi:uncharacterized protein KY384_006739 [Bacidia gigantensis]|uniref:uncharacterized protein n=1 Tax=Bacidia gigantensis TaxID=2732470 RepID=UPI001D03794C|nr:uncharacterized protein KY384_006739 [Bacidia gigantensis]KAG8528567.1 hypothetical protein KY384_006739 [Bacidia gigantensis]